MSSDTVHGHMRTPARGGRQAAVGGPSPGRRPFHPGAGPPTDPLAALRLVCDECGDELDVSVESADDWEPTGFAVERHALVGVCPVCLDRTV